LVDYIAPEDATGRKDLVQAFGLIVAGVVGLIGAIVGLVGLYISRKNLQNARDTLQQQREIEDQRAQDTALQAFFEQIGDLLTDQDLLNTDRVDIPLLAQAQTLTVVRRLDASGKGHLLSFLYGSGLIAGERVVVSLSGANLRDADLSGADLRYVTGIMKEQIIGSVCVHISTQYSSAIGSRSGTWRYWTGAMRLVTPGGCGFPRTRFLRNPDVKRAGVPSGAPAFYVS